MLYCEQRQRSMRPPYGVAASAHPRASRGGSDPIYIRRRSLRRPRLFERVLWTRREFSVDHLVTELVAEDQLFERVVTETRAPISAAADWTCRVLVGGLQPFTVYWYRFTDPQGNGSRIGRAPSPLLPNRIPGPCALLS